jgi:hypothetical protein
MKSEEIINKKEFLLASTSVFPKIISVLIFTLLLCAVVGEGKKSLTHSHDSSGSEEEEGKRKELKISNCAYS